MDRLTALHLFVRVVETGSFSAVAREQATTQSAVSKQIAALETQLRTKLLSRSTRALSLTGEGEILFPEARRLVSDFDAIEGRLRSGRVRLTGLLRVAASVGYGRRILMPRIKTFLNEHQDVRIDLRLSDGFVDLVEQGIDVAIRVGELPDSSLVARKIGVSERILIAHRSYFETSSGNVAQLEHLRDLTAHNCIVYTEVAAPNVWEFVGPSGETERIRVSGNLHTNSSEAIRAAALSCMGICYSPNWLLPDELASGEVIRLLPEWRARPSPIHAVFPVHKQHVAKIETFIKHVSA